MTGALVEGWYCIENGGVSVHRHSSNGIVRRSWAATPYNNWDSMARIVLRELAGRWTAQSRRPGTLERDNVRSARRIL
jgi:hypothetical protein